MNDDESIFSFDAFPVDGTAPPKIRYVYDADDGIDLEPVQDEAAEEDRVLPLPDFYSTRQEGRDLPDYETFVKSSRLKLPSLPRSTIPSGKPAARFVIP